MSAIKPSSSEEDYFAREEAEKKRKLQADNAKAMSAAEIEALKKLHHMKCPKCGMDLMAIQHRGLEIDKCSACNGVWLDEGEMNKLSGNEGVIGSFFGFFKNV